MNRRSFLTLLGLIGLARFKPKPDPRIGYQFHGTETGRWSSKHINNVRYLKKLREHAAAYRASPETIARILRGET